MVSPSPLRARQEEFHRSHRHAPPEGAERPGAARGVQAAPPAPEYLPYGPPEAETSCELLATFGALEAEYAAIRKGAGILDAPHRAVLVISGADRRDFLDRMLTQKLVDLAPGRAARAFWLNRKGRIEADLLLLELGDRVLADLDIHCAARTVESLGEFLFTEDVEVTDATAQLHRLDVHGPAALETIGAAAGAPCMLDPSGAATMTIAGIETVVARSDQTGEIGLALFVPVESAGAVWDALVAIDESVVASKRRVRPVGWHAFNIARIEAGTPLHLIDFGPENLPHETGVLDDRVSFAKGCYLGQEVVARIQNLGRPRQRLVGLRVADDRLPVAGAAVYAPPEEGCPDDAGGPPIGGVTSSTLSPLLGRAPVAFAMVKSDRTEPGSKVRVSAEGGLVDAVVGGLRMAPGPGPREPS